jgi:Stress responsive A/B Barrel Domain
MASMLKHIVMFSFRESVSAASIQAVRERLLELPSRIALIKSFEIGMDIGLESGQNHPAGKNRAICWSISCDSPSAYETYAAHPAHQEFLQMLKPLILPGSRAAIQYEIAK